MSSARIPVKTRLKHWHLSRVPFPAMPFVDYFNEDPLLNGSVFTPQARQQQLDQLRVHVLRNGWPDAVSRWEWVWAHKRLGGSLGMGKSALLGYVTDQINKDFGSSFFHRASPWLAVYVKVSEKAQSTAQVMATAIASIYDSRHGVSVERRLVGRLRHGVVALNASHQYAPQLSAESETKFADDTWLESQGVRLETLNKGVGDLLRHAGVRAAVADAVAACALREYVAKYKDDADNPLFKPAYAKEAFVLLLNDIAKIARAAHLQHVTMIVDDFYFLVKNTKPADREALAAEWREIVVDGQYKATQGNIFNWVAVMHTRTAGTFNQAWENVSMHNVAPLFVKVGDTIDRPGVHLRALPQESGRRVVESFLQYSRSGRAPSSTSPFTDEALAYIVEYARKKGQELEGRFDPRSLLEVARMVFVSALFDENEHTAIDLAFAQHVLEGISLPEPAKAVSIDEIETADEATVIPSERRMSPAVPCSCPCHLEDNSSTDDLVALIADAEGQVVSDAIAQYRCLRCNAPVLLA